MTAAELIQRGISRAQWWQNDLAYKPPESFTEERREFQGALPWLIRMMGQGLESEIAEPLAGEIARWLVGEPVLPPTIGGTGGAINIVIAPDVAFPDLERFIEIEYDDGRSLGIGTRSDYPAHDGWQRIRITPADLEAAIAREGS